MRKKTPTSLSSPAQPLMKHLVTIFLFILSAVAGNAQEFDIRSFSPIPNDLSARKEVRRTVNDEPCALIKVVTNIKGMQFESNSGIVDVEHKADGYWLYVWPRERRIKLMATGYLSMDARLPEPAKELVVYELVVATKGGSVAKSDLVRITFRINEADAYIAHGSNAPVMTTGKNAVYDLPPGVQQFTFRKAGFEDKVLDVEVNSPEVIDVALEAGTPSERIKLPGFIIVTSEPSGAEVFLNDQRVGQTPYQGRQLPGYYRLALRNHLYHDHEERFDLAEGGTSTLPLVKLKPRFGFVNLSTDPAGAEVYLDGKMVGKSPIQGLQVESGSHNFSLRSTAYHELNESFAMSDGETKDLQFALRPAFGTLSISSDPEGAEVFLDEQRLGTTPFRQKMQPSGAYNLRLELPMHSTERSQIEVKDEESTERFFALSKNYGTMRIESEDAEIFLDGKQIGTGSFDHRTAPGSYTLTAKKDRHDDDSREVFLTIGQVETITLNPEPRTGVLSIMTEPFEASGAEVWIDGKKTEYKTPAVVELLEGEYVLELRKPSYGNISKRVVVIRGRQEDWKAKLYQTGAENLLKEKDVRSVGEFNAYFRNGVLKTMNPEGNVEDRIRRFGESNVDFYGKFQFQEIRRNIQGKPFDNLYLTNAKPAGPERALQSLILPGWGTMAVTGGEKGMGRMLLFGITAGTALGTRLASNRNYERYRAGITAENRSNLYSRANLFHQISLVSNAMAVSISIYDVIWVIRKGAENKRRSSSLQEQLKNGWIYVE